MVVTRFSLSFSRSFRWAGGLLGFSLGGFFDGIVLHQVLQWHHVFSAVQAASLQDQRAQLQADGWFHLRMYAVAGLALYLLWRARVEYARPRADRVLWANVLVGFGTWHALDGMLVHGLLGWHHIRMDVANPVPWDLLWLALFGLAPLVAGWWLRQRVDGARVSGPAAKPQR